jgi:hypothetical protein
MKPLPEGYIPCYREAVLVSGRVVLSEENVLALFRMAETYHTYRRTLEQIGKNGTSNADLALQARNALREESPTPPPRKRLVAIGTIKINPA